MEWFIVVYVVIGILAANTFYFGATQHARDDTTATIGALVLCFAWPAIVIAGLLYLLCGGWQQFFWRNS